MYLLCGDRMIVPNRRKRPVPVHAYLHAKGVRWFDYEHGFPFRDCLFIEFLGNAGGASLLRLDRAFLARGAACE